MYIHTCMYMYKPYHVGTMSQYFGVKMLNIHVYMYMYICIKRRIPYIRLLVIKGFTLNAEIAKISISENN